MKKSKDYYDLGPRTRITLNLLLDLVTFLVPGVLGLIVGVGFHNDPFGGAYLMVLGATFVVALFLIFFFFLCFSVLFWAFRKIRSRQGLKEQAKVTA